MIRLKIICVALAVYVVLGAAVAIANIMAL